MKFELDFIKKLSSKKWLYFGAGSIFTLLVGAVIYFGIPGVLGQSLDISFIKAVTDPSEKALQSVGWAELQSGTTVNSRSATSGLIVIGGYDPDPPISGYYGRVGIGFPSDEIPSEILEVRGNVKVVDRGETTTTVERLISPVAEISQIVNPTVQISDRLRLSADGLDHLEQRTTGTSYYWVYNGNCSCSEARRNQTRLADAHIFSLSTFSQAIKKYLGALILPQAWAVPTCYNTQEECINAGGSYCVDYGDSCVPGQYDIDINCTSEPTKDAQCNSGDTPVSGTEDYNSCWGTQYIGKRQCQTSSNAVDWYNKILFSDNQTVIDDDLVADNNQLSNCSWTSASECGNGQIMAGYDGIRIKCCNL